LDAIQELRTCEDAHHGLLDAEFETLLPAGLEEFHRRRQFSLCHRAPEGTACKLIDDSARTGRFVTGAGRFADEYPATAWSFADARDLGRPHDFNCCDIRHA